MENSNSLGGARIALLIDFDNVILGIDDPGFDVELVVNALRERGTIVVSRVYGDWYRHSRHRRKLMEHGLELVEAPAFGPVIKNSADIKIALDGLELGMTQPHINTFCLVSGDSDFLPLIKKLQGLGKNVLVICGNRFTSDMLRRNCNEFISYENLLAASYGADEDATTLEGAFALLHRAMEALRERGSEIRTSTLKQMMIQLNPVFSEKTFGYNQFRGFLDKAGRENLIKLGPRDRVSGEFYVLLPEEDEAEVIEQIERAESAPVVEEVAESRKNNGRNRRGSDRKDEKTKEERKPRLDVAAPDEPRTESEEVSRPRSRREARLIAHREQSAVQQSEIVPVAAPLATPLTPATDFSPADARETQELSISRDELLSRGLRVGKFKFSGAKGVEKIEASAESNEATPIETAPAEIDIALAPEDVTIENGGAEDAPQETLEAAPEVAEKSKRSRSRRRKKSAETSETQTPAREIAAPESETSAAQSLESEVTPTEIFAPESASEDEAEPQAEVPFVEAPLPVAETEPETAPTETKPRRRSRARAKAKTDEATAAESASEAAPTETAETTAEAPAPEKPKRARRRKKTDTEETPAMKNNEKAVEADGTQHTVSTEALIEASANTPAAQKPKPRSRRSARKISEESAGVKTAVDEKIVTNDQTTGESQQELAQIPVPVSEDEV